jgi:hypothetical protein
MSDPEIGNGAIEKPIALLRVITSGKLRDLASEES